MPEFSDTIVSLFQKRAAAQQGGLLAGADPSVFNSTNPLRLWIIQLCVIVCTASLLSLLLSKMRQPKVIAEVLGGILLGPTAFGRIPGFTEHIFPAASLPYLSLVAHIGLCLFLFLVGLEIDGTIIKRNGRRSSIIALAGMIVPFGIGAGLSLAIYKEFIDPKVQFTHFMLFVGVAYSITAFPVLARILTELKLLDTTVGVVVLSAGVGNDVVGWILLALTVALVNAGSGLMALYILLVCIGWTIFLLFPVKLALKWLAIETGSIETGPSVLFMTVTLMILFGSAFFTDIIGVNAIFGAFLAGIIVPREGGLAIAMTEKLEDMVTILFLPLYFTLSGLSTNIGLLNNGVTWAYTIAVVLTAFVGKFGGGALSARYFAGFDWRESGAIGSLLSCKGLVELIVLNVGLSAGILSQRVFSIFVLQALVLTFLTTPLVTWFYPPHVRRRTTASGAIIRDIPDNEALARSHQHGPNVGSDKDSKTRFTVVLDKLEQLPGVMALAQLIQPPLSKPRSVSKQADVLSRSISIEALRLIELSDRVSAVMKGSIPDTLLLTDPMLSVFRMFGHLNGIKVSPALAIVKFSDMAYSVAEHAKNHNSDMILIPWLPPVHTSSLNGNHPQTHPDAPQPFALPITSTPVTHSNSVSFLYSQFVRGVFSQSKTDVALFVDQSTLDSTSIVGSSDGVDDSYQHVFLPFFGGPDDRLALDFVVQICANPRVRGTVVRMTKCDDISAGTGGAKASEGLDPKNSEDLNRLTVDSRFANLLDTVYGQQSPELRMESDTADNVAWARYAPASFSDTNSSNSLLSSKPHPEVMFKYLYTREPLHATIQEATAVAHSYPGHKLVVVTGRSRRLAVETHRAELRTLMDKHGHLGTELRKTVGDVATALVVAGVGSAIVVVQAAVTL